MAISCRRATPTDATEIHRLIASLAHHRALDLSEPAPAAFVAGFSTEVLKANLGDPRYAYLVAGAGGDIIGVLGLRGRTRIHHLFVAASWQRRGVATGLWNLAWEEGLLSGQDTLLVKSSVYAVRVYERFGFVATGPVVTEPGLAFVPMVRAPGLKS